MTFSCAVAPKSYAVTNPASTVELLWPGVNVTGVVCPVVGLASPSVAGVPWPVCVKP